MAWMWLAAAIAAEVTGTVLLKYTAGFTRPIPSILAVAGYGTALVMLARSLGSGMQLGVAYGVWAAAGVALVAIIGTVFLGETLSWVQLGGIALVIAGVMALEMGGPR